MKTAQLIATTSTLALIGIGLTGGAAFATTTATETETETGSHHTHTAAETQAAQHLVEHAMVSGWIPTEYDTCSKEAHDRYKAVGPDGAEYDTWHPTIDTDPATGQPCTYGHEHGVDPTTSDIYQWTLERLSTEDNTVTGIPFGFTGVASSAWEASGAGSAHRHEDHFGHKVFVANDVKLVAEDRTIGYIRDAAGEPVTCDYLIGFHQGTHSSDATKNNAHELIYSVKCSDGTEAVVSTLTPMGGANQFTQVCSDATVATSGSNQASSNEGRRRIPDKDCLSKYSDIWSTYETWETVTDVTKPGTYGSVAEDSLIRFEPWFGVRNPSRYYDNDTADTSQGGRPMVEIATKLEKDTADWPWSMVGSITEQFHPDSPFDGAMRDFYLDGTIINNADGPTTWYTDPFGGNASTEPFEGSVKQYISATSTADQPTVARQAFGFSDDYGADAHAPN